MSVSLILRCFLGLRQEKRALVLDPAIPPSLDGLRVELEMLDRPFEVTYRIGSAGCGAVRVNLNGVDLRFTRGENPYRTGAAEVPMAMVLERLRAGVNRLSIELA